MDRKKKKIMVIDDEAEICDFIDDLLSFRFDIIKANSGEVALKLIAGEPPDLIILDMHLQQMSGLEVCQKLRENPQTKHIPVLIYTGHEDIENVTEAFDRGADDFISKSARPKELIARILSKVRRIEEKEDIADVLQCGNLTLDSRKIEASIDGKALDLSVLEFTLLTFFVKNRDRVMSRQHILEGVWKDAVVSNRTIDTHMVYLRKKLSGFNHVLATVYGAGYILKAARNPLEKNSVFEAEELSETVS